MRFLIFILFLFPGMVIAQHICNCKTDSLINKYTVDCKTTYLKNGSKLYYQFNCDSIWLSLENRYGLKKIIFSMGTEFYAYTYRLGYFLQKEYSNALLFRTNCAANGPCNHILVNKSNGKTIKTFGELIYDPRDEMNYDFIIYFTNSKLNSLTLYYAETNKKYKIPLDTSFKFNAAIPEDQLNNVVVKNHILSMSYDYDIRGKHLKQTISIDLRKYPKK